MRACAALLGLHETVPYRALGGVQLRDARVLLDTGYEAVDLLTEGLPHDYEWPEDGDFELALEDKGRVRAKLSGRLMQGLQACGMLEEYQAVDPDDCDEDSVSLLTIDYVRVEPAYRGRGYGVKLIQAAKDTFTRRGAYIYADVHSQLIYTNFRRVLPAPFVIQAAAEFEREEPQYRPADQDVLDQLDALPVESKHSYKGYGRQLANARHVHVVWKV
jgi:GNAT superfamily N-acetyltransferase